MYSTTRFKLDTRMQQTRVCLRNFAKSLAAVLRGSQVYVIDYTARESCYEYQDASRQTPLIYTRVVRINQVYRLSSIIY